MSFLLVLHIKNNQVMDLQKDGLQTQAHFTYTVLWKPIKWMFLSIYLICTKLFHK